MVEGQAQGSKTQEGIELPETEGVGRSMFVSTRGPRYDQENRPLLDPAGVLIELGQRVFRPKRVRAVPCCDIRAHSSPGTDESVDPGALALNALIRSRRRPAGVAGTGAV